MTELPSPVSWSIQERPSARFGTRNSPLHNHRAPVRSDSRFYLLNAVRNLQVSNIIVRSTNNRQACQAPPAESVQLGHRYVCVCWDHDWKPSMHVCMYMFQMFDGNDKMAHSLTTYQYPRRPLHVVLLRGTPPLPHAHSAHGISFHQLQRSSSPHVGLF